MNCLSLEELFDYLRGQGAEAERAAIAAHLETGCPHCLENQRWLRAVERLAAEDDSITFPEQVIARVVSRFREQAASRPPLRQLIAQLIFDSLFPQRLAPVRSAAGSETPAVSRQVLYRAEGYDIDLRFERHDETEDLIGQVQAGHSTTPANYPVQLWREDSAAFSTQTNARGIFRFTGIPAGSYQLKIQVPEGEISIPQMNTTKSS